MPVSSLSPKGWSAGRVVDCQRSHLFVAASLWRLCIEVYDHLPWTLVKLTYDDVAEAEKVAISNEVRRIGRHKCRCCGPDPFTWPLALAVADGHGKLAHEHIEFCKDPFEFAPVTNALRECDFAHGRGRLRRCIGNSPLLNTYSSDHVLTSAGTHHSLAQNRFQARRHIGISSKHKLLRRVPGYTVFFGNKGASQSRMLNGKT